MAKTEKQSGPVTGEFVVLKGTVQTAILKPTGEGRPPMQVLKSFGPGQTVVLDVEEAQELIAQGVLKDPKAEPPAPPPVPANAAPKEGATITQTPPGPKVDSDAS